MRISRRDFLDFCGKSGAAIGLTAAELASVQSALGGTPKKKPNTKITPVAKPKAPPPTVLWIEGAGCSGCSISFLNRIAPTAPTTAGDVLINTIKLAYHPELMAAAGQLAIDALVSNYNAGSYILVVEGGVPTAYNGYTCVVGDNNGQDVTFKDLVLTLSSKAAKIICLGNCAAWGGMSGTSPNPTGIVSVKSLTGKTTINVPGCPPHPDWLVGVIAKLIAGSSLPLDSNGRPTFLFNTTVHDQCPLRETDETQSFGVPNRCLHELGCRGPETLATCPATGWNGGVNWCIGAGAICMGCTSPSFPGTTSFFNHGGNGGGVGGD